MLAGLDEIYELNQGVKNDHLAAYVADILDGDHRYIHIYAGNYDDSETFKGNIHIKILKEDNKEELKTYNDVTLMPNEKKKLERYYSTKASVRFQYFFEPF